MAPRCLDKKNIEQTVLFFKRKSFFNFIGHLAQSVERQTYKPLIIKELMGLHKRNFMKAWCKFGERPALFLELRPNAEPNPEMERCRGHNHPSKSRNAHDEGMVQTTNRNGV
jgi:hypothetical protein